MPEGYSFRQVDEKHVSGEVTCMLWSPKMDLIAVANVQGEVLLYRLTERQKVWTLAPPQEEVKVTSLAWRPDGKVLAAGYSSGQIRLCDVENADQLHLLQMCSAVSCLTWTTEVTKEPERGQSPPPPPGFDSGLSFGEQDCFVDMSAHYLAKLPSFSKVYTTLSKSGVDDKGEDSKRLKDQKDLNILVVGTEDGHICLFAYGIFPIASLDLREHGTGQCGRVLTCYLSHDFHLLSAMVETTREDDATKDVFLISFDSTLLASRHRELRIMALKFGQVLTLMKYLDSTIQQMIESWEDILLEIDSKLIRLAEEKYKAGGGTVSNDFLKLLMIGRPSEELQNFLLMELTEKGLKKLGHSIDASYSNIQKLILKHLQSVGQALVYHLADIHGMSQWFDKFGVLGLAPEIVQEAVQASGTLMLKASELQQVIDGSMRNFKAFFRWIYVIIQRLSDEPVSTELSKMTQQDLNFVAQFLKENFTEDVSESHKKGFKVEKVGQYLRDQPLQQPPDVSGNPWVKALANSENLQPSPLLYKPHYDKSLIQVHMMLKNAIEQSLLKCANVIGQSLECVTSSLLYSKPHSPDDKPFRSRWSQNSWASPDGSTKLYTMFTADPLPCSKCYIMSQETKAPRNLESIRLEFGVIGNSELDTSSTSVRCDSHTLHDLSFYDDSNFCVLLQEPTEDGCALLCQVPLFSLDEGRGFVAIKDQKDPVVELQYIETVDVGPHIDKYCYRRLENMKAVEFAVSGARRVACVLFVSRRRVRLFMMDAEDEEEEEDEDTGAEDTTREDQDSEMRDNGDDDDDGDPDEDKENVEEVSL